MQQDTLSIENFTKQLAYRNLSGEECKATLVLHQTFCNSGHDIYIINKAIHRVSPVYREKVRWAWYATIVRCIIGPSATCEDLLQEVPWMVREDIQKDYEVKLCLRMLRRVGSVLKPRPLCSVNEQDIAKAMKRADDYIYLYRFLIYYRTVQASSDLERDFRATPVVKGSTRHFEGILPIIQESNRSVRLKKYLTEFYHACVRRGATNAIQAVLKVIEDPKYREVIRRQWYRVALEGIAGSEVSFTEMIQVCKDGNKRCARQTQPLKKLAGVMGDIPACMADSPHFNEASFSRESYSRMIVLAQLFQDTLLKENSQENKAIKQADEDTLLARRAEILREISGLRLIDTNSLDQYLYRTHNVPDRRPGTKDRFLTSYLVKNLFESGDGEKFLSGIVTHLKEVCGFDSIIDMYDDIVTTLQNDGVYAKSTQKNMLGTFRCFIVTFQTVDSLNNRPIAESIQALRKGGMREKAAQTTFAQGIRILFQHHNYPIQVKLDQLREEDVRCQKALIKIEQEKAAQELQRIAAKKRAEEEAAKLQAEQEEAKQAELPLETKVEEESPEETHVDEDPGDIPPEEWDALTKSLETKIRGVQVKLPQGRVAVLDLPESLSPADVAAIANQLASRVNPDTPVTISVQTF